MLEVAKWKLTTNRTFESTDECLMPGAGRNDRATSNEAPSVHQFSVHRAAAAAAAAAATSTPSSSNTPAESLAGLALFLHLTWI